MDTYESTQLSGMIPDNNQTALARVMEIIKHVDSDSLSEMPKDRFLDGWLSISFLFPGLHPDELLTDGSDNIIEIDNAEHDTEIDKRLITPCYEQSGWPVILSAVVDEAYRRNANDSLTDAELYCYEAAMAGILYRDTVSSQD